MTSPSPWLTKACGISRTQRRRIDKGQMVQAHIFLSLTNSMVLSNQPLMGFSPHTNSWVSPHHKLMDLVQTCLKFDSITSLDALVWSSDSRSNQQSVEIHTRQSKLNMLGRLVLSGPILGSLSYKEGLLD